MLELLEFLGQCEHYRLMKQGSCSLFLYFCVRTHTHPPFPFSPAFIPTQSCRPVALPVGQHLDLSHQGYRKSHHFAWKVESSLLA